MIVTQILLSLLLHGLTHQRWLAFLADKQCHIFRNGEKRHILKNVRNETPHLLYHLLGVKILRLVTALVTIGKLIHLIVFQQNRLNIDVSQLVIFRHRLRQCHLDKRTVFERQIQFFEEFLHKNYFFAKIQKL